MKFNFLKLAIIMTILHSCNQQEKHNHGHSHSGHEFNDKHNVEEMAKQFESSERDSTQKPYEIIQYLGDIQGKTVMDIGAASGYFSVKLAEKGANVIAADVSDEFQGYLKERIAKNQLKNISLRKIPYHNPNLTNQEADIVFIANTYHHMEDRIPYLSKVKKGLKPNGDLVIVEYYDMNPPKGVKAPPAEIRVSIDKAIDELKKSGFTHFEINTNLLAYQYIIKAK